MADDETTDRSDDDQYLDWEEAQAGVEGLIEGLETVAGWKEDIEAVGADLGLWDEEPSGQAPGGRWVLLPPDQVPPNRQTGGVDNEGCARVYLHPKDTFWGEPVEFWPEWIPLADCGTIREASLWLMRCYKYHGVNTYEDAVAIAAMDPITGVAPAGTPFSALTNDQQRAYIANLYIIGLYRNRYDPEGIRRHIAEYKQRQADLGYCQVGSAGCGSWDHNEERLGYSETGKNLLIMLHEATNAAERLLNAARGGTSTMATNGTTTGVSGALSQCLAMSGTQRGVCLDQNANDPSVAVFRQMLAEPWRTNYDEGGAGLVAFVDGEDDAKYVVIKAGKFVRAVKVSTLLAAGFVMGSIGTTFTASLVWVWMNTTAKGKKFKKKLMG